MEEKKFTSYLVEFIILAVIGIGLIVLGVILDRVAATSFIPTDEVKQYSPAWYIYLSEIGGAILFLLSF